MKNIKITYQKKFIQAKVKSYPFHDLKLIHPYQVLGEFFDAGGIESHLNVFKQVYRKAIGSKRLKRKADSIMYDYELFSKLLNATWVIYKTKVKRKDMPLKIQDFVIPGGVLDNCVMRKYLTDDEINNPYLGFFHNYKEFSLGVYHRNLYHWFWFALSDRDLLGEEKETKRIYKNVCKIIICSWLIYEKELLQNELEVSTKLL